jgi:hypothetical protein
MPCDIEVIHAGDFMKVGAHGRYDLASSRRALANLAATMLNRGFDRALLDLRDVASNALSATELFSLASTFKEAGFEHRHRVAVLHRYDRMGNADFFAMVVAEKGFNVRAFDSFEDAFLWLAEVEAVVLPECGTQQSQSESEQG